MATTTDTDIAAIQTLPFGRRIVSYARLTGPGYMQSAMTLGGGSIASCAAMGSLLGYELLWVQPLGMLVGFFLLAAIAKQTTATEERTYGVFWRRLHPVFAVLWAVSSFVATIIWHIPQYSLTANGVVALGDGIGVNWDGTAARVLIGAVALLAAVFVVYLYNAGARGLKTYERAVKTLVWLIVFSFLFVVISTGVDWVRFFRGISGVAFLQDVFDADGLDSRAVGPIVGGIAAAVGINMVFLYPYSLLNKKWGTSHKELAYFDLVTGMALPFILATGLMIIAVANTIGPAEGMAGAAAVKDIREIVPVLGPTFDDYLGGGRGAGVAWLVVGLGMTAIGFSTIITHMLACGFIGCEMFNYHDNPRMRWVFSLFPAVGVVGVIYPFPVPLAITASTLAAPLMPVAVACFLYLMNDRGYLGSATPQGSRRVLWNTVLAVAVIVTTVNAFFALRSNWETVQERMASWEGRAPARLNAGETSLTTNDTTMASIAAQSGRPGSRPSIQVAMEDDVDLPSATFTHPAMATEFSITLYGPSEETSYLTLQRIANEAFAAIDDLEARISSWIPSSQISRVNDAAGGEPAPVGYDVLNVVELSKVVWKRTDGAFDLTVGPLLELWGIYRKEGELPSDAAIAKSLALVGMDKVEIDAEDGTIALAKPGMRLDFGGIGKGLALDEAAAILRRYGITRAALHGGTSTVLAIGAPPAADGWTVHIRHPYNADKPIDTVSLRDAALSTSGCYGDLLSANGTAICDILDPRTGRPVDHTLSVSVVAPTGAESDALSTGLLVLGRDRVAAYTRQHPEVGVIYVGAPEAGNPPVAERINLKKEQHDE